MDFKYTFINWLTSCDKSAFEYHGVLSETKACLLTQSTLIENFEGNGISHFAFKVFRHSDLSFPQTAQQCLFNTSWEETTDKNFRVQLGLLGEKYFKIQTEILDKNLLSVLWENICKNVLEATNSDVKMNWSEGKTQREWNDSEGKTGEATLQVHELHNCIHSNSFHLKKFTEIADGKNWIGTIMISSDQACVMYLFTEIPPKVILSLLL